MIADDRRSYERAKDMGAQARRNGRKKEHCPFRLSSSRIEYAAWHEGWEDADSIAKRRA